MNNFKISIILPCYNVDKYLPKCLNSIVNQTYKNLEIICIIDGSPDNSLAICNEYAEKDSRIVIVEQENQGVAASRNNGLKFATGQLIMFVDADDWINAVTCEKAIKSMQTNDADVVIWSYIREFAGSSKPKDIFNFESKSLSFNETRNVYRRLFGLFENELSNPENTDSLVTVWGKLYKREILEGIQFIDSSILSTAEDLLFNIYVFSRVKKVSYINERLTHYRKDNKSSITSNYKSKLYNEWDILFDKLQEEIICQGLGSDFQQSLNNRIALGIVGLGLNELENPNGAIARIKKIKEIIASPRYRQAYKKLTLKYFPIHWKVFFLCARMNFATGLYILLILMKKMIGK